MNVRDPSNPPIAHPRRVDDAQALDPIRETPRDRDGVVRRAVVGDDDLPRPVPLLRGDRPELIADRPAGVPARNDDRHVHGHGLLPIEGLLTGGVERSRLGDSPGVP